MSMALLTGIVAKNFSTVGIGAGAEKKRQRAAEPARVSGE